MSERVDVSVEHAHRVRIVASGVPRWRLLSAAAIVRGLDSTFADLAGEREREAAAEWAEGVLLDEADATVEVIEA